MTINAQRSFKSVSVGDDLTAISIPITLQRLVMEAGANRDLSLIHHDRDVARSTGAADAYMNTFFISGMFERLLREWMGYDGRLNKITNLRMKIFNLVGDTVTFHGRVSELVADDRQVVLELWSETDQGTTVTAQATVTLPQL
jgi:acyl dehydratase